MFYLKGQKHFNDCGVAVTATILGLYGVNYNYKSLGNIDDFLDIIVTLKKYKIDAIAYQDESINFFPCIIQIRRFRRNHFIVIYEEKNNYLYYFSPNKMFVHKIKKTKLMKYYTSKVIYIERREPFNDYEINFKSIPYSVKLIIFDVITLILIYNILTNML